MTSAGPSDRTALYRLWNAANVLLYIGITNNPGARFAQHAATKPWWSDVERRDVVWYDTREEAVDAEIVAIRDESPVWNIITGDEFGCARFLPKPDGSNWGRPTWTPRTDEERFWVAEVVRLADESRQAEEEVWLRIRDCIAAGIPLKHIAERTGRSRSTLNRKFGTRKAER